MTKAHFIIFCAVAIAVCTSAQFGRPNSQSVSDISGRNTAPETILGCYRNITAYDRFKRQPMHIENLIAIIRKIEEKTYNQWDMRRIVRSILHRFDYPGLRHNPNAKDDFQFERIPEETSKANIILSMIPGEEPIPDGILDNDDKCALHWMLSHSMNATMREEESSNIRYPIRRNKRWTWSEEDPTGHSGSGSEEENAAELKSEEIDKVSHEEKAKTSAEKPAPVETVENKLTNVQPVEDTKSPKDETSGESKLKSDESFQWSEEAKKPSAESKETKVEQTVPKTGESKEKSNESVKWSEEANKSSAESKEIKAEKKTGDSDTIAAKSSEEKPGSDSIEDIKTHSSDERKIFPDSEEFKSSKEKQSDTKEEKIPEKVSEEKTVVQSEERSPEKSSEEHKEQKVEEKPLEKVSEEKTVEQNEERLPEKSSEEHPAPKNESHEKEVSQEDHKTSDSSEEKHAPVIVENPPKKENSESKSNSESVEEPKQTKQDSPTNNELPPAPPQSRTLNIPSDADDSEGDVEIFNDSQSGASKVARQSLPPTTKMPIETGVVYTKWGTISAARVLAGIAAGLEPLSVSVGGLTTSYSPPGGTFGSVPSGNYPNNFPEGNPNQGYNYNNGRQPSKSWGRRKKRQTGPSFSNLENLYAGTLAGDIGQAAILNAKYQMNNYNVPVGVFNSTICPREYILNPLPNPNDDVFDSTRSWTYMTEAEVRGAVDGMILGNKVREWNMGNELKLSQLLAMYYSEKGVSNDPTYRSCDRTGLYNQIDASKLKEQSRSFAWLYNNRTSTFDVSEFKDNPNKFESLVNEAFGKAISTIGAFSNDDKCERRVGSVGGSETDDNLKDIDPKTTIYAVIDQTVSLDGIDQQKKFLGTLVAELDIKPRGSRLGLMDGNSGQITISPNYTDNAGVLPCTILSYPMNTRGSNNHNQVLASIQTELQKIRNIEENQEFNIGHGNGITLLFFVQGKLDENQREDIRRSIQDLSNTFGDLHIMYTSNVIQQVDVENYALDPANDFIRLQGGDLVVPTVAREFIKEYNKRNHARLYYPRCNARHFDQNDEHKQAVDFFMYPNTIQYYKISPDYFYSAKNLRLRFTSDNGKVRVCWARNEKFPSSKNSGQNGVECKETSGSYLPPGSSNVDIDFGYKNPCGKNGNRGGCTPVYISVTPTTTSAVGSGGLNCNVEGCEASNQVKITFTHWDMRCNSGIRAMISSPVALITVLTSILAWFKST